MADPTKFSINVPQGFVANGTDATKIKTSELPQIYKTQQKILAIDLIQENGSFQPLNIDDTFHLCVDDDFNPASTPWIETLTAGFNLPGQRSDLNIVEGRISCLADANTTEFIDGVGATETIILFGQVEVYELSAVDPYLIANFKINGKGLVCGPTSPVPPPGDFYTKTETDSLLAGKEDLRMRKQVPAFDATLTPSVVLHTVSSGMSGLPVKLYMRCETITGSVTTNFTYSIGVTGNTTKYVSNALAPASFNAVGKVLPVDMSGFETVDALADLILTINNGSDATTMTVKPIADIAEI